MHSFSSYRKMAFRSPFVPSLCLFISNKALVICLALKIIVLIFFNLVKYKATLVLGNAGITYMIGRLHTIQWS